MPASSSKRILIPNTPSEDELPYRPYFRRTDDKPVSVKIGENYVVGRKGQKGSYSSSGRFGYLQQVTVKARVATHDKKSKTGGLSSHISYITRGGTGEEGKRAILLSSESPYEGTFDRSFVEKWQKDRHHFRFIISPEKASELDLNSYLDELMLLVERDLSQKLSWYAAIHYNTDNPHIHLIVRGKREDGRDLVLPKQFISFRFRQIAGELATRFLGKRSEKDLHFDFSKQVKAIAPTQIDYWVRSELKEGVYSDQVSFGALHYLSPWNRQKRGAILSRLQFLTEFGLAKKRSTGDFELADDFIERLSNKSSEKRALALVQEVAGEYTSSRVVLLNRKEPQVKKITGLVVHRGLLDELYDTPYIVVAADDGATYHVPFPETAESKYFRASKGSFVEVRLLRRSSRRKVDQYLERFAISTEERTVLGLRKFLAREGILPKKANQNEFIENLFKRLEGLKRVGVLAAKEGQEALLQAIPTDLEKRIEEYDEGLAQYLVEVQKKGEFPSLGITSERELTYLDEYLFERGLSEREEGSFRTTLQSELRTFLLERVVALQSFGLRVESTEGKKRLSKESISGLYNHSLRKAERRLSKKYNRKVLSRFDRIIFRGTLREHILVGTSPHAVFTSASHVIAVPHERGIAEIEVGNEVQLRMKRDLGRFDEPRFSYREMTKERVVNNERDV